MPIELLPEKLKGPVRRLRKLMLTDSGVLVILGVFFSCPRHRLPSRQRRAGYSRAAAPFPGLGVGDRVVRDWPCRCVLRQVVVQPHCGCGTVRHGRHAGAVGRGIHPRFPGCVP